MRVSDDLSFLWRRVSAVQEPLFRFRELQRYEPDLWEPLVRNGLLNETPIPESYLDEKNRWMLVRQVNGRLFGVEDSDEPNGFEVLSEDDVRQYCFSPSSFADSLRQCNAVAGKGLQESERFIRLGDKRISSKDTLRVYLAIGSGFLDSLELRLRALARERSRSARVVVFPVYPDLDSATEELLEASNLFVTDFDTASFEINWPMSLGIEKSRPQHALICEGKTWRFIFDGEEATVADSKGIRFLAKLLSKPSEEFSAFALANPKAASESFEVSDMEVTDTASLRRYKERILDIEEELEEAIAFDREDEIERLEEEKDSILKHLSSVSGAGGRSRLKGEREKARLSVLRAFQRMFASLPIGRVHIESRLKTGYTCTYTPESGEVWKVDFPKSS
ncbi:hypothetical protein QEH56_08695 [Pelagicoccus enzymogenes]|uniref:hypothetical protein n=1 Tax=Pelagicoccus enzymogenes TaxID=2773457 RepID=UPI00280D9C77|nr:hypothetical protein [Pelagicoccus enzymogenes]MDQ8198221.1 hypothetical protein [Pelagicoccus enzymogenes]